jgi:hypothetical protein
MVFFQKILGYYLEKATAISFEIPPNVSFIIHPTLDIERIVHDL